MPLNKQKGNMYGFVTDTWNPIRGRCAFQCSYCHPAGTTIMMSDFSQKDIKDVVKGDRIIGVIRNVGQDGIEKGYYRFKESTVIDISKRRSKTIRFKTADNELSCTKEHPLMGSTELRGGTDWKAARAFSPFETLRYVSHKSLGRYFLEQRIGYIRGIIDGDGCVFKHYNKEKREYFGFEIVCVDEDLRKKIKNDFLELFGVTLREGIKKVMKNAYGNDCVMLTTRKSKDVILFNEATKYPVNITEDFAKGYIAGMIDTDGSVDLNGKSIRISQSITANPIKYQQIIDCCDKLGLKYTVEKKGIRILANFKTRVMILCEYGIYHSEKRRRLLIGSSIKGTAKSEIISITAEKEQDVYNLQTECENFIANGFIVHNCYMKRWKLKTPPSLIGKEMNLELPEGRYIFVGSSIDMWHPDVPDIMIREVLRKCRQRDNTYLFQTKNPRRFHDFERDMYPEKTILCTTMESDINYNHRVPSPYLRAGMMAALDKRKFRTMITVEPIMDFNLEAFADLISIAEPEIVNIGANTSDRKLPEPTGKKLVDLLETLQNRNIKLYIKPNLKRICPYDLSRYTDRGLG